MPDLQQALDHDGAETVPGSPLPTVLLVEDEPALVESIRYSMDREGMRVVAVRDGARAMETFRVERPTVVVLDLMLPNVSGLDLCRMIRAESVVPIVILTAKDAEADKVAGLELGADDYVTKPFSMRELASRLRAQLRRSGMTSVTAVPSPLRCGPVELDPSTHEVWLRGSLVQMPPKEFDLLETLLRARGRLLTREHLIDEVWGPDYVGDTRTLDVHVKRLRTKIEEHPANPRHLVTVRGLGYRFVEGEDAT